MTGDGPLRIYTDGACSGNPGPGGWAWASSREHCDSGGHPDTTNNKMELTAVLEAMRSNPGRIIVVMDSTYVKDGLEKWSTNWIRNGWMTKAREPVKNKEIWVSLIEERVRRGDEVRFEWVKGHSGDPLNDLVDELAVVQRDSFRRGDAGAHGSGGGGATGQEAAVSGSSGQDSSGAGAGGSLSDLPLDQQRTERRRRDGRIPAGHLLAVFGLPPDGLGGWDPNPTAADVRRRLQDWFAAQALVHRDLRILTGLRPGAELVAAEACLKVDVPYVAVIGFPDMTRNLSEGSKANFADLVARADSVVQLEKKSPIDKAEFIKAMGRRDAWLTNAADAAVLVWDERDARLQRAFSLLDKRFGPDLYLVRPDPSLG
ncbi:MAG: ribonuclease H [Ilumatobacteraceae bacterium]